MESGKERIRRLMRKFALVVAVLAVAVAPACLFAQAAAQSSTQEVKEPEHYYKLNFTLEELNDAGKVANSRNYVATIVTGRGGAGDSNGVEDSDCDRHGKWRCV